MCAGGGGGCAVRGFEGMRGVRGGAVVALLADTASIAPRTYC